MRTSDDPLLTLLAATPLFSGLAPDDLRRLLELTEARAVPAGAVLCREGDVGESLFIVTSGELRVVLTSQGGERVLLAELGPGAALGEISLLDGGLRTADIVSSAPTGFLELKRKPFLRFLESVPRFAVTLLQTMATRLRSSAELVREIAPLHGDPGAVGGLRRPFFELTQVGYGRYGNRYVGPKYAKPGYLWEPRAVVDPGVSPSAFAASVLGQARPDVQLFERFEVWERGYLQRLPEGRVQRQIVELALKPELMFAETMKYLDAGMRQLILPKPVVMDADQLAALTERIRVDRVKAAVASQWYYSDVPPFLRRTIRARGGQVVRVEMDFSKENGLAYETDPPLLELPHVLQLLESCGLVDMERDAPEVSGDLTRVEVRFAPPGIRDGVRLVCETDLHPTPEEKARYPAWDVQIRTMKVFFDDDPELPGVSVDFWVKFDRSGDFAIRPGAIATRDRGETALRPLTLRFVDDQLMVMSERIFEAMREDYDAFVAGDAALSLSCYGPIGLRIMEIQSAWERAVAGLR
ncbi:MAG: cyclic nucleotide-binding domain-containing protein [Alphaproteobacteria bacterium]|nr:cyclic nucleotide-binding domain-containing protein [Alphaproteobacteria bacterium]MCB9794961.1 cyclic nucleotide-binding domain-containing protein [Alphaproteobacteria bacterium]